MIKLFVIEGFRDIKHRLMSEFGFRVEMPFCPQIKIHCTSMPYCLSCDKEFAHGNVENEIKKKNKQLTTRQANNTRNVTKVI